LPGVRVRVEILAFERAESQTNIKSVSYEMKSYGFCFAVKQPLEPKMLKNFSIFGKKFGE